MSRYQAATIAFLFISLSIGLLFHRYFTPMPHTGKFPSKIDHIYVINLKSSEDLWRNIEAKFKELNITNYSRFDAVNGRTEVTIKDQNGNLIDIAKLRDRFDKKNTNQVYTVQCRNKTFKYKMPTSRKKDVLSSDEIGCYCSHILTWEEILKNRYQTTVVFEDDIKITDDLKANIDSLLSTNFVQQNEWDIIYISFCFPISKFGLYAKTRKIIDSPFRKLEAKTNLWCAQALIFNISGIEKLLANMPFEKTVDNDIRDLILKKHLLKAYYVSTFDVLQDNTKFHSTINQ